MKAENDYSSLFLYCIVLKARKAGLEHAIKVCHFSNQHFQRYYINKRLPYSVLLKKKKKSCDSIV